MTSRNSRRFPMALPILCLWTSVCLGTDRSFDDIAADSPDGEWKVSAISPDNRIAGYRPWQDNFVYSAFRSHGTELAWTREQAEQRPNEGSPVRIVVADNGWVAIHTAWDQLVFVDAAGRNRGRIDDIKNHLPKADLKEFGVHSTGGLIWSPHSLWYFLPVEQQQLFVVRLWWGRRIIINPESGEAVRQTEQIGDLADRREAERAIALLGKYEFDPIPESDESSILLGAHLAGSLLLEELIPWLRNLEQSEHVGITSFRFSSREANLVDPFSFRCYTARQVSRLSLRRLGAKTDSLPIYEFRLARPQDGYFRPEPLVHSVESRFPLVKSGMTAKEVLDLVGSPDFVVGDGWEFDTAGESPATFIVEWEDGRVSQTRKAKAKWDEDLTRDQHIVLF